MLGLLLGGMSTYGRVSPPGVVGRLIDRVPLSFALSGRRPAQVPVLLSGAGAGLGLLRRHAGHDDLHLRRHSFHRRDDRPLRRRTTAAPARVAGVRVAYGKPLGITPRRLAVGAAGRCMGLSHAPPSSWLVSVLCTAFTGDGSVGAAWLRRRRQPSQSAFCRGRARARLPKT